MHLEFNLFGKSPPVWVTNLRVYFRYQLRSFKINYRLLCDIFIFLLQIIGRNLICIMANSKSHIHNISGSKRKIPPQHLEFFSLRHFHSVIKIL